MAEIRIERKRGRLGWLWLLLALLVVAALAWYFLYPGRTTPAAAPPTTGALDPGMPEAHRFVTAVRARPGGAPNQLGGSQLGGRYGEEG